MCYKTRISTFMLILYYFKEIADVRKKIEIYNQSILFQLSAKQVESFLN